MLTREFDQLLSSATDLARLGWRWWVAELRGMLPARIAALAQRHRARLLLEIHEGDIVVARAVGTERTELARVDANSQDHDQIRGALAAGVRRGRWTGIATVLRLSTTQVLRRRIPLPLAAAKSLRQVLAHEFDRQMSLSREQAYFDCRVIHRDREKKQITAELIAVRRAVVDKALELARAYGLRLTQVELTGEGDPVRLPGLLEPPEPTPRSRWEWRVTAALVVFALLLGVGTLAALIDRQQSYGDAIEQELATTKSRSEAAKQLLAKVAAVAESQRFLPLQKRASSVMTVLNEVTRVLPDDVWLFDLEVRGKAVRLHGFGPAASSLLGLFAQSPLFENARFRAPLTQAPHGGLERFDLSMDFKGGTMIARSSILRRVLALAILAAIPLTIWFVIVDPIWQGWTDAEETEGRSLNLISDLKQTAAMRPALETDLKTLEVRGKTLPGFVTASTPALAAASVQAEIKRIIESKGGQVRSTQDLQPTRDHGVEKIGVRFDITTSLEALPRIVYEIEAHSPYFFIDNLEIRAPEDARPESYVADKPILIIRWDVYGYRAVGET